MDSLNGSTDEKRREQDDESRNLRQGDRVEQRLPSVFSFHGLSRRKLPVYVRR
jgi:hypothetical protein